jgi:hypothetical protein
VKAVKEKLRTVLNLISSQSSMNAYSQHSLLQLIKSAQISFLLLITLRRPGVEGKHLRALKCCYLT